ncbi:MAG: hypothetical protein E7417_06890 [Ruminococcaceae bacterium]|nr:hypothetical protein [Oscillospiraceae bacterium]
MLKKFLLTFVAVITLSAGMSLTVSAQETVDSFDYKAYADTYPDLKAVYGYDANALFAHYINFGKAEGRIGNFAGVAAASANGVAAATPATSSSFSINTISIGGDTYILPCPVSQFLNNGWVIDKQQSFAYADNGVESRCILKKGNETFYTEAASPYLNKKVPIAQGLVRSFHASVGDHDFPPSLVFGGCLTANSTKEDVEAILPSTFDKKTYNSDIFSLQDTGHYFNKQPITTYSNWRTGFYEGHSDFILDITFSENRNTIRQVVCQWQN